MSPHPIASLAYHKPHADDRERPPSGRVRGLFQGRALHPRSFGGGGSRPRRAGLEGEVTPAPPRAHRKRQAEARFMPKEASSPVVVWVWVRECATDCAQGP